MEKESNMENQRMEKFKNIFRAMDKGWLFRHYVYAFGFIILSLMLGTHFQTSSLVLIIISALFYPFAMFIYENIFNFLIGGNFFILPANFLIFWKLIRFAIILIFAIPIGTIGLAFLYYQVNKN